MKYRVINSIIDESFDIITENGGIASVHHTGEYWLTTYYQGKLTDISPEGDIWEQLSEYKTYSKDWGSEVFKEDIIIDALWWLGFPCPDFEIDNNLFTDFFSNN